MENVLDILQLSENSMDLVENRLKTLEFWPVEFISKDEMAKSGFFYNGLSNKNDTVNCYSCNLSLCDWKPGQDPNEEHERYSKDCHHLREFNEKPKYPEYESVVARRNSFANWPFNNSLGPNYLYDAGIFYISNESLYCCYQCGEKFEQWDEDVDLLSIHRYLSPNCRSINSNRREATNGVLVRSTSESPIEIIFDLEDLPSTDVVVGNSTSSDIVERNILSGVDNNPASSNVFEENILQSDTEEGLSASNAVLVRSTSESPIEIIFDLEDLSSTDVGNSTSSNVEGNILYNVENNPSSSNVFKENVLTSKVEAGSSASNAVEANILISDIEAISSASNSDEGNIPVPNVVEAGSSASNAIEANILISDVEAISSASNSDKGNIPVPNVVEAGSSASNAVEANILISDVEAISSASNSDKGNIPVPNVVEAGSSASNAVEANIFISDIEAISPASNSDEENIPLPNVVEVGSSASNTVKANILISDVEAISSASNFDEENIPVPNVVEAGSSASSIVEERSLASHNDLSTSNIVEESKSPPSILAENSSSPSFIEEFLNSIVDDKLSKEFDNACCICFEGQKDIALNPCGHIFCSDCSLSLETCPTCRESVISKLKLYY